MKWIQASACGGFETHLNGIRRRSVRGEVSVYPRSLEESSVSLALVIISFPDCACLKFRSTIARSPFPSSLSLKLK